MFVAVQKRKSKESYIYILNAKCFTPDVSKKEIHTE